MWIPNLVLAVIGVVLLFRRNRDKSLLLSKVDRWVREDLWSGIRVLQGRRKARQRQRKQRRHQRRVQRVGAAPDLVLRLPRLRLVFPNLIDRYVIRVFCFVFFMVLLSALSIYVIADFSELVDEVIKNDAPRSVVFDYYKYLVLQIFYDLAPILVLVATLITFSLLSRSNEVTAWKALGVSLYRLAVPAVFAALGVAVLCALLQALVLPASNARVAQAEDRIRGRETPRTFRRADRQWLFGQDRYVYNYLHYDAARETLQRLQVFEFDDEHRLVGRLFASAASFDPESGRWRVDEGWIRRFDGVDVVSYQRFDEPRLIDFPETPEYFQSEVRAPEQMNYGNLQDYIDEVEASGQRVPELRVQLHNKLAYPVVALVMALVALPFAFRLGRQGALYGIGLSIVLGMVFYVVYAFFTTLGEASALPPLAAVWSPGILFTLFATYLFLGVRT
jgi:LPS export ABC transporter permease LptG